MCWQMDLLGIAELWPTSNKGVPTSTELFLLARVLRQNIKIAQVVLRRFTAVKRTKLSNPKKTTMLQLDHWGTYARSQKVVT